MPLPPSLVERRLHTAIAIATSQTETCKVVTSVCGPCYAAQRPPRAMAASAQAISKAAIKDAAASLRSSLSCELLLRDDPRYEEVIRLYNVVDRRPAIVVRPVCTADVQEAVRAASRFHLPLSVRGGGSDWAGRALCSGIVLDMRRMNAVTVSAEQRTVTLGGGAQVQDVASATEPHGLAMVLPTVGTLGAVGWALGGGLGPLNARFGLGVDNILSAELVLADGSIATASATQDAELLWALRGGGGGFGAVTSLTCRLHAVEPPVTGSILFPLSQAALVQREYQLMIDEAPDELGLQLGFLTSPADGQQLCFLFPYWTGDAERGRAIIDRCLAAGSAVHSGVASMSQAETLRLFSFPDGCGNVADSRNLSRLSDASMAVLSQAARDFPTPHCMIAMHDVRGAAARVAADAAAFPARQPHLAVELIAIWKPSSDQDAATRCRRWLRDVSDALAPHSFGCWSNLMGDGKEEQQRVRASYGGHYARLQRIKRRVDPHNLFSSAIVTFDD